MKENKMNLFLIITSFLSIIMLVIGGTYSYFNMATMSKMNAVAVEAGKARLGLAVSPVYTGYKLIPTNDKDIMIAYNQKCLDDFNNGACLAYGLEVFNFGKNQDIVGTIDFNLNGIDNLSYLILDENGDIYLDKTVVGEGMNLSLGPNFNLGDAPDGGSTSKKFILVVWLTNLDVDQNETDAGGEFAATVTYSSVYGNKLTASIAGEEKDGKDISQISEGE